MQDQDKQSPQQPQNDTLDSLETIVDPAENSTNNDTTEMVDATNTANNINNGDTYKESNLQKKNIRQKILNRFSSINIYLLIFILILVITGAVIYIGYSNSKKSNISTNLNGQELSQEDLSKLSSADQQIGDSKQTLTIASNAVFNGRVLVRENLDVAGTIRVGGLLSLPGITVSGNSSFENVQIASNLAIAGNTSIQGALSIQQNLTVGGSASFAGQITAPSISVERLILSGDLQINRHIDAGGGTPSASRGPAVGGSGTVSLSGTDTAGTVSINFGPGSSAGNIANINFANQFSQTPHIVISPVGSACASLGYYTSKTSSGFSINVNLAGSSGSSCAFDYIAID